MNTVQKTALVIGVTVVTFAAVWTCSYAVLDRRQRRAAQEAKL